MTDPRAIYLELGERLTRALLSGDFELYRSVMALPLEVLPRVGKPYRLETEAAMRESFLAYGRMIALHRITDLFRDVRTVERTSPGRFRVVMQLTVLSGGNRVVAPFESTHELCRTEQGWRIERIIGTLGHTNWIFGDEGRIAAQGENGATDGDATDGNPEAKLKSFK